MATYERMLRLRSLRLAGWQRELLGWGVFGLSVLLALADLISPWGILVLPVAVALLVKLQDLLSERLSGVADGLAAHGGTRTSPVPTPELREPPGRVAAGGSSDDPDRPGS